MEEENFVHPFYPIIYVRGYAGNQTEIEDTVSDPYMGFNLGSTKLKQAWTGELNKYIFESPLVRLMKDYDYLDVYDSGEVMPPDKEIKRKSIIIYRYYENASKDLGSGVREEIEEYAEGLGNLIISIYLRFKEQLNSDPSNFKVYLVAHSMGGLICRCFMQNDELGKNPAILNARKMVDKIFTYATPHNGIDLRILGNLPSIFQRNNVDNFNRKRMSSYLSLDNYNNPENVASLDNKFDPNKFFCLVGTSSKDYPVAAGLAAKIVGPMSDGLVQIKNATVWGPITVKGKSKKVQSPRAFTYRSHSGPYGIVNSEEGYQNLVRFLFGDLRVDGKLIIKEITLPQKIEKKKNEGKQVRASYHFESILRVRGMRWDLHRRTVDEHSAIFRTYDDLFNTDKKIRNPHLFSVFLSTDNRVNKKRKSLGFSLDLRVLVPEYEVDGFLFMDSHYEGGYLYRDKLNLEAFPPNKKYPKWRICYGFDSKTPNRSTKMIESLNVNDKSGLDDNSITFEIPIEQKTNPGIDATLKIEAIKWNKGEYTDNFKEIAAYHK